MEQELFISTSSLQNLLTSNSVQVLDCSINKKENHFQKRIPGARYFSLTEIPTSHSPLSQELPASEEFANYMKALGVRNDGSAVVVYDQSGFAMSGRAWFALTAFGYSHVRILDGGLVKWTAEGRSIESGEYGIMGNTLWREEDYRLTEAQDRRVHFDEIQEILRKLSGNSTNQKIWDPRPHDIFIVEGHVDHSINVPISLFFNKNKTVKSREKVEEIINSRLGQGEIIISCTNANMACLGLALLTYIGKHNARVYTDSS